MTTTLTAPATAIHVVTWETPAEMLAAWPVLHQWYPDMTEAAYRTWLQQIQHQNYRQFACITDDGQCVGIVGLWLMQRLWCGVQADVDNFVVDANWRSQGVGKRLLATCERFAKANNAKLIVLDSYVDNPASHRFYFREGYTIRGYRFVKPLQGQDIWHQ